ncbi:hypothetical protein X777_03709 [Ooceraea biroi]|uniref:Uncharacterized protein n=1 Tax=Ooceraea biroi TaxID=2015173 RepID=A0A026WLP8_OOCBI|nr:hypothetical protein X777_03709 [Ooceraea biroi]
MFNEEDEETIEEKRRKETKEAREESKGTRTFDLSKRGTRVYRKILSGEDGSVNDARDEEGVAEEGKRSIPRDRESAFGRGGWARAHIRITFPCMKDGGRRMRIGMVEPGRAEGRQWRAGRNVQFFTMRQVSPDTIAEKKSRGGRSGGTEREWDRALGVFCAWPSKFCASATRAKGVAKQMVAVSVLKMRF